MRALFFVADSVHRQGFSDTSTISPMVAIRPAEPEDLASITEIYNEAILTTVATFDTEPKTVGQQRAWFESHGPRYPIIVAELDGTVVGWASLSPWSDRCAYADTAEISLYVKEGFQGMGIGRALLETITQQGRDVGLHTLIARIAGGNETSVRLHEAVGFEHIGVMKEVGRKFGRLLDVYLMQKIYGAEAATAEPSSVRRQRRTNGETTGDGAASGLSGEGELCP